MISHSDENCNQWHASAFAFRTGANFSQGFINTTLSATGAVAGLLSGAAASGVAAGNASIGALLNGINTSYYANKAIDQIETEMQQKRSQLYDKIKARIPQPEDEPSAVPVLNQASPEATATPVPYWGGDAKPDLIAYDNLCSLEIVATSGPSPAATATLRPPRLQRLALDCRPTRVSSSSQLSGDLAVQFQRPTMRRFT